MTNKFNAGDLVVVTLAHVKGFDMLTRDTSAAVVVEAHDDNAETVIVRLTGLVPAPYDPGMVLAIDGAKTRKAGW